MEQGRSRQDLFYRINVITLRSTPLRERAEDIPALAGHILRRLAEREGGPLRTLPRPALAALCAHPLPGNVRELENLLERACALADGQEIREDDLDLGSAWASASTTSQRFSERDLDEADAPGSAPASPEAEESERLRILKMLDQTHWNRSEAARRLGMTLRQLRYRLQKWGME